MQQVKRGLENTLHGHFLKNYFNAYIQGAWFQFAKANLLFSNSRLLGSACKSVPVANLWTNILKYELL